MFVCTSELTRPSEANNPFHADGELRRKADFILTHSRISRTEMQIADPDGDTSSNSSRSRLVNGGARAPDSTDGDGHVNSTPAAHDQSPQHRTRRHDDETTVVTVTSRVATPQRASTAEKIKIENKRCAVQ